MPLLQPATRGASSALASRFCSSCLAHLYIQYGDNIDTHLSTAIATRVKTDADTDIP